MRILVLANPASGRGRGAATADAIIAGLRAAGRDVDSTTIRECDDLAERASGAAVVVVCGGDGTVHHALDRFRAAPADRAEGARPAIYHAPCGTENLFARQFRMTRDPAALVRALERFDVRDIDLGFVRGRPFVIMVSVGPDASVIQRVNQGRVGGISHWSYALPIAREALRPALPRLSVQCESAGERIVIADGQRGWLIVANMRQYAARIDPCPGACCDDGLLDVAFFPARSTARLLRWVARARFRLNATPLARARGACHTLAERVSIVAEDAAPLQIDGEAGGAISPGPAGAVHIGVEPRAIRVLIPAPA